MDSRDVDDALACRAMIHQLEDADISPTKIKAQNAKYRENNVMCLWALQKCVGICVCCV